jgi:hypothetical protein
MPISMLVPAPTYGIINKGRTTQRCHTAPVVQDRGCESRRSPFQSFGALKSELID